MADKPLDSVYSFVERAYLRLQAGDILTRCLDEASAAPIQEMVEGLVLAGPKSLDALREVLGETSQRKNQVIDDVHQVETELKRVLKEYGIPQERLDAIETVREISPAQLLALLLEHGVQDAEPQEVCLRALQNSTELVSTLSANLHLLAEVERYLMDWLWGLAYQSLRGDETTDKPQPPEVII